MYSVGGPHLGFLFGIMEMHQVWDKLNKISLSKLWDIVEDRGACYAVVHGAAESEQQNNITWHG